VALDVIELLKSVKFLAEGDCKNPLDLLQLDVSAMEDIAGSLATLLGKVIGGRRDDYIDWRTYLPHAEPFLTFQGNIRPPLFYFEDRSAEIFTNHAWLYDQL
jgi:hypothetical protein